RRLILDPHQFYILASKERMRVPGDLAAEMVPIDPSMGEFRAHYAGFFDPGFGDDAEGPSARAVLEVRSHDVPFILEDGQTVGRLVFEKLTDAPDRLYGSEGATNNYQAQGLKLSKHFRMD
ncbi:MAG: 2'-deoxycytidine 5'-triphosphate deaminase, partial [Pseudomonadota bacterium]